MVHVGVAMYYHMNKKYISEQLCENRNNPSKHCKGHCYLSKQLEKADEGEKKQSSQILKEKEELVSENNYSETKMYSPSAIIKKFHSSKLRIYVSDFKNELVKPPNT